MSGASRDLAAVRRAFAESLAKSAGGLPANIVEAFASVPREDFLGPPPWQLHDPGQGSKSRSSDPSDLYRDVLVSIDPARKLNNGHPSSLAAWIGQLELQVGERVGHIGAGVGYYTAVLAHLVGPSGHVLGVEIDPALAARARANLEAESQVEVIEGDGATVDLGQLDGLFVNAGATHVVPGWLDALAPGGRMLVPLTASAGMSASDDPGFGGMLRVRRHKREYIAEFVSPVGIFPCLGTRDPDADERLKQKLSGGTEAWQQVQSLRRDAHDPNDDCWLHGPDTCLSTRRVA